MRARRFLVLTAWLSLSVCVAASGCAGQAVEDPSVAAYVNADGELVPPDDGKADSAIPAIERALINRDDGVIGSVQLSYRSALKLANEVGMDCDATAVIFASIARQESAFRVTVAGPMNSNGTFDYGVWQINNQTGKQFGYTVAQLKTARPNAEAMMEIKDAQGIHAWAAYNSGRYKKFMPYAQEAFDTYGCQ